MTESTLVNFFVGVIPFVVGAVAFWLALPRYGQVRSFLRNDQVQAYYTVAIVVLLGGGVINIVLGLMAMSG
jgi:divalent metal cation (Fe/Co/Zn/Cd) transporter